MDQHEDHYRKKPCIDCHDLPWRRPERGCQMCLEPFELEPSAKSDPLAGLGVWRWMGVT